MSQNNFPCLNFFPVTPCRISKIADLFEVLIEETIEDWIEDDRGHGDQMTDDEEDHDNLGICEGGFKEMFEHAEDVDWCPGNKESHGDSDQHSVCPLLL